MQMRVDLDVSELLILDATPSPHQNARPKAARVDCIVLHTTGSTSTAGTLTWFARPESRVSAHYVIDPTGVIYRCVPESARAWHAGKSSLHGRDDVNDFSLGIELVHPGDGSPYPIAQVGAAVGLVASRCGEYGIPLNRVVGHADVCVPPGRKTDPAGFDWMTFLLAVGREVYP